MIAPSTPLEPVHRRFALQETARILTLSAVAAWLLHPFATSRQVGAGDALWYANMLADFCLQLRAGIFPVFVGQTEFAFNGAVYPLRVAPLYQHLGGTLDLLTGHRLDWFSLQHGCVVICGFAGILTSYLTLVALAPARRWTAAGLAILYLSCPGVLGTIYTQDLYMTWVAVPFVPLAVYGMLRTYRDDTLASQVWLSASLAILWFSHAPVALWMTFIAGVSQVMRLAFRHRSSAARRRALAGVAVFLVLANYPFISVWELQVPGAESAVMAGYDHPEAVTRTIREVFPAIFLPVSSHAQQLSDLQLGYGFMAMLLLATWTAIRIRRVELLVLLGACTGLLVLLIPIPRVTDSLWHTLPDIIRRITLYWPMHRFYLLLAALLAAAGQLALAGHPNANGGQTDQRRFFPMAFLVGCSIVAASVCWSLREARQFVAAGVDRTASREGPARAQLSENLLLMKHSYGLFANLPAYFSNGVMDPAAEVRLWDNAVPDSTRQRAVGSGKVLASGALEGVVDENPGILKLSPSFSLEPGKRYDLEFTWARADDQGVLQLLGKSFFREYSLPRSGEAWAFGCAPSNSTRLPMWTSGQEPQTVTLRFIPTAPGRSPMDYSHFARYTFRERNADSSPTLLESLVPRLRIRTRSPGAAVLETPRMFAPGYEARVDDRPTTPQRSAQGLLAVPVPPGDHRVEFTFHGSWQLRLSYWASLTAWFSLVGLGCASWLRGRWR